MPKSVFFGWKVVGAAFIAATFAWGVGVYGPPVFLKVLHETRGWPISLISTAITCHFLIGAVTVLFLADLHRAFGVARITAMGALALSAGVVALANTVASWQLFGATLILGFGWGLTSGAAINAMVAPWFDQKRALALSLAFNGASVGGILFVPLWVTLISALGFPSAAALVGGFITLVLSFLALRFFSPTPLGLGEVPDGQAASVRSIPAVADAGPPLTRRQLCTNRQFVTLALAFALGLFAQVGLVAHMVTFLAEPLGSGGAAAALSLTTACAVTGRLVLGTSLGNSDRRKAAAVNFLIQACGTILLAAASSPVTLLIGCTLFGLGNGNLVSLPALIAQREFSVLDLPRVVALEVAIHQTFFAFGPGALGILRDLTGSYIVPILIAAAIQCVSAAVILMGQSSARPAIS